MEADVPEVDEKVMGFVEKVLEEDPEIQNEDLFERTKKFKPSIARLSKRQFNARYPLQVKRRRALAARKAGEARSGGPATSSPKPILGEGNRSGASRDAVRQVFLRFATDIAAAEERKDLVKVLADVDRYVDRVLESVTGG
jgi:hypothetical protein